ncbi:tyrosine recombinase XerC [Acinetobacter indicus]|uniref:tyrosine recombinase XerC n=1 Tax=Acinetobacter TaxID=469 RepID=UPI0015D0E992|nr:MULTISPECIES: tyrosine recombinase XerC [Acinetobacter]MCP0917732.1 tyrosine recombinase XerC [Acinetobacter indicus]
MQTYTQELLEKFINEQEIRSLSANTIRTYQGALTEFFDYCEQNELDLNNVEQSDLRSYISDRVIKFENKTATLIKKINAIRQFMQWALRNDLLKYDATEDFKINRSAQKLPGMLDIETVNRVLDQPAPADEKEQLLWVRDKAMLELLYSSGLRIAELHGLRIQDIDHSRLLVRVTGKGNKTRVIPMGRKARDAIMLWLQIYTQFKGVFSPNSPLFLSRLGRQLSMRQIRYRVVFQAERAGIQEHLHPHLLRHCFASHMLSNSGDLRAVQEMLGHANLNTTQIYTHLDFDNIASVYDKAHPRASLKK